MKRFALTMTTMALALAAFATSAQADFGFKDFDISFNEADGSPVTQAGSHPFAMTTTFHLKTELDSKSVEVPDGQIKDLGLQLPAGFAGQPSATPRCSTSDFISLNPATERTACPDSSVVGTAGIRIITQDPAFKPYPLFNLAPPPGMAARFGFVILNVPATIDVGVNPNPPFNVSVQSINIPQVAAFFGSKVEVWGNPADHAHDPYRGSCLKLNLPEGVKLGEEIQSLGDCPTNAPNVPFLTLPRACTGPVPYAYRADPWDAPGAWDEGEGATAPFTGCGKLGFSPSITAKPTTKAASSPTGLDFSLDVKDAGLTNPDGIAGSDIKKAVVTLPEGMSVNPSIADGLAVCSPAQLAGETADSPPGAGCPQASKIGSVEVETPLLEENVNGALYQAAPYDNPFDSLIALYIVIKNPTLGIIVKQPIKVEPDPVTGRLTTVAENLPQLPFSHFRLHFREGARSPLASPAACGAYDATATLTPWSGEAPLTTTSTFQIFSGPNNGPCPAGGLPPFKPGLTAGTINNAAGRFSPFNVRLSRTDSEQEFTRFSIKLPPGITAKLAGVPYCSDVAIAAAKARTGPHGGAEELASPSCPAASQIGRTLAGSGVGPSLAYAPGKLYLAGPYHGAPISMVAITSGVVGPFDIGTVVIREAFKIDPETAEVFIDSTGSDPIPHIIRGVPIHLRDIRAYADRPSFVLNPTDCTRTSTASTLLGSGLDFVSDADDRPVTVATPFQAADCAALPFKPRLSLRLKGGTRRGAHPAFKATLRMNGIGEAGIQRAQVTLPRSEFIENAHFNTICTRVQFKAGNRPGEQCPAGSVYGKATAVTPILGEPLTGPVFLRSSEHQLPDLVVALHNSQLDFVLVGHVDSVKGRLRNTFETAPDAPVSSFTLEMQGGKKGLFVNSTDLCKSTHRAEADFSGQNGKELVFRPELKVKCGGKGRRGKAGHKRGARG